MACTGNVKVLRSADIMMCSLLMVIVIPMQRNHAKNPHFHLTAIVIMPCTRNVKVLRSADSVDGMDQKCESPEKCQYCDVFSANGCHYPHAEKLGSFT